MLPYYVSLLSLKEFDIFLKTLNKNGWKIKDVQSPIWMNDNNDHINVIMNNVQGFLDMQNSSRVINIFNRKFAFKPLLYELNYPEHIRSELFSIFIKYEWHLINYFKDLIESNIDKIVDEFTTHCNLSRIKAQGIVYQYLKVIMYELRADIKWILRFDVQNDIEEKMRQKLWDKLLA